MVYDKVNYLIVTQFGLSEGVSLETNIFEDLGADSVDLAELIVAIEDEFSLPPTERATQDVRTVGDLVKLIESVIK